MRPGFIFLIIGGALLGAGLVIGSVSVASVTKQVLEGSAIIDETELEPGLSIEATMKELPAGQQLLLSLAGEPTNVPLSATIIQPDGTPLETFEINATPFTGAATTGATGDHTLRVTNVGNTSVTVSGGLLNSPIARQDGSIEDDPSIQSLVAYGVGILVAFALIIAGIVLLIIGAVKFLNARKGQQGTSVSN